MASSSLKLFFFFFVISILSLCSALISSSSPGVVLPVAKDPSTLQYVAEIRLGDSPLPIKLVVDLGGPFLWLDCSSGLISSSATPIPGTSNDCAKAAAHRLLEIKKIPGLPTYRNNDACYLLLHNGAAGLTARGELADDVVVFGSVAVQNSPFACAPRWLLQGLPGGARGVLGLGKAQISLPSQLAAVTGKQRRLTVYLSPSDGVVSTNSAEEIFGTGVSRSLVYTPLLANPRGNYVINVKSIRIDSERLAINSSLWAELSTVAPYTMLESWIYKMFVEAYTEAALKSWDARKVEAVAPFSVCFADKSGLPGVEMALQSEMVKWRIAGVVDVGDGVGCLGVMDGGRGMRSPIVMGGHQLEGYVLDFDMGNSMMGFGRRLRSVL